MVPDYKKLVSRTGCQAKLRVIREDLGPYLVSIFESSHNHALVPIDQCYLLRSSRNLKSGHISVLEAMHSAGIGVSVACKFMEKESGGVSNLGFIRKDAYHHMERLNRATKVVDGDATQLVEFFTSKTNEEPFFFWKYELDDSGRVMNFFYRDSRSAVDYDTFGDVLSVDTTYRTNRYNLICAPFVGISHHCKNVLFGMAFMSDETTASFEWLFKTFLESMNGKEPKVIFTDQCQAMMNAIDSTFKIAKHRLCQWHINQNAPSHFGKLNGDVDFKAMWYKCMNRVDCESEFEDTWRHMMDKYSLGGNRWFSGMYKLRRRWASVFTRDIFSAGLLATSRSESTNKVLKDLSRATMCLVDFVKECDNIQGTWRRKEREEDTYCLWLPGQYLVGNALSTHAATVYTRTIFKLFENEVRNSFNVILSEIPEENGENLVYTARSNEVGSRLREIFFNRRNNHAKCTCKMWESEGILCRHIIKVYYIKNVCSIPNEFILKRWTKTAKQGDRLPMNGSEAGGTMKFMLFVNEVMRHVYDMASSAKEFDAARVLIVEEMRSLRIEVSKIVGNIAAPKSPGSGVDKNDSVIRNPQKIRERAYGKKGNHFESNKRIRRRTVNYKGAANKVNQKTKKMEASTSRKFMDMDHFDFDSENATIDLNV